MKILVTGGAGFVGRHLIVSLREQFGRDVDILVTSRVSREEVDGVVVERLDVTDAEACAAMIEAYRPTHIVHLAGLAAVQNASSHVGMAWRVHVFGTLNIANAVLKYAPDCVLLFVSSGQIYGSTARHSSPLTEESLLAPMNDYAVTKAAADLALGALAERGLRVVRLRPFNHTGRGQTEDFVIPSFASQIARIEAGQQPAVIRVGNLNSVRDFLDVRDVARSYALALAHSDDLKPGAIYNIASGTPRLIADLLQKLLSFSSRAIEVEYDSARMRPADTPFFVGDASLAKRQIGWEPLHDFEDTLRDILASARLSVTNCSH